MQRELPAPPGEKFTAHLLAPAALWGRQEGKARPGGVPEACGDPESAPRQATPPLVSSGTSRR